MHCENRNDQWTWTRHVSTLYRITNSVIMHWVHDAVFFPNIFYWFPFHDADIPVCNVAVTSKVFQNLFQKQSKEEAVHAKDGICISLLISIWICKFFHNIIFSFILLRVEENVLYIYHFHVLYHSSYTIVSCLLFSSWKQVIKPSYTLC